MNNTIREQVDIEIFRFDKTRRWEYDIYLNKQCLCYGQTDTLQHAVDRIYSALELHDLLSEMEIRIRYKKEISR